MQDGSVLEARDLLIGTFFLLFCIKLSKLVYSTSTFGKFSKENIFFINFLSLIIFFNLLNCSIFETKIILGVQSLRI